MKVMRRYCDYDYDNNCIILFDADDEVNGHNPFESKFNWISSGDNKDKKYHAAILNEQKEEEKKKQHEKEKAKAKEVKAALREYLKTKYQETKANVIKQQKLLEAQKSNHKQQIESMAAYKSMQPISYYNNNNPEQYIRYFPRRQSIPGLSSLYPLHPTHGPSTPRALSHSHSTIPPSTSPRYHHQQNINHPKYLNNNNMINPNYAAMNVLIMPKMHHLPQKYTGIHENKFNGNYRSNAMRMRPCIEH